MTGYSQGKVGFRGYPYTSRYFISCSNPIEYYTQEEGAGKPGKPGMFGWVVITTRVMSLLSTA